MTLTPTERVLAEKIVAIIRLENYDHAIAVARALSAGGISTLEFTLTGKGAYEAITAVRKDLGESACVGVGSVITEEQVKASIDAGAEFVVTPAVRPKVIAACVNRNTLVLSGGFTPTELLEAHEAGSTFVKLFPARLAGPGYLKDVLAPLPFLKLVPTGGVSPQNARDYLAAGAVALGIGGNLVSNKVVNAGAWDQITAAARETVAAVRG